MPKRTVSKTTARKIFIATMGSATVLALGIMGSGFFRAEPVAHRQAQAAPVLKTAPKPQPKPAAPALQGKPAPAPQSAFIVKRILDIKGPLNHGDWAWDEADVPAGPMVVTVDLEAQTLSVFRDGYEIGVAVILYGATDKPTPLGTYPILEKDKDHYSNLYDNAPMPYSLRLTHDGVFIHASSVEWGNATHGCIGLPLPFARKLFAAVKVGDPVVVTSGKKMDLSHLR